MFPIVVLWMFLSLRYGADLRRSRLVYIYRLWAITNSFYTLTILHIGGNLLFQILFTCFFFGNLGIWFFKFWINWKLILLLLVLANVTWKGSENWSFKKIMATTFWSKNVTIITPEWPSSLALRFSWLCKIVTFWVAMDGAHGKILIEIKRTPKIESYQHAQRLIVPKSSYYFWWVYFQVIMGMYHRG